MSTYVNIVSILSALLLVALIMATTATLVALVTIISATIAVVVVAHKKHKKQETAFWAQAEVEAKEAFEEEEIKNFLLEEMKEELETRIADKPEEPDYEDYDPEYISGKGGKKKYIPLMSTPEGDDLWLVKYSRGRDGWSRSGNKSGKHGYHDPMYKDHRDESARDRKRLDASWYVEAF